MERPLRDDVARPVRAYLAALVPGDEVSDAWHELVADVSYWRERELLPTLRLAHQVVLQHQRVAPEVAALALVDVGVDDPDDVAVVLDADATVAGQWLDQARASRAPDTPAEEVAAAPKRFAERPRPATAPRVAPTAPAPQPAGDAPTDVARPPAAGSGTTGATGTDPAVRIGFDEDDGPLPDLDGRGAGWSAARVMAWVVAALVVVLAVWGLVVA